jgi:hypothetical protein
LDLALDPNHELVRLPACIGRSTRILSELVLTQKRTTRGKVHSLHAPKVKCIAIIYAEHFGPHQQALTAA